jgi:hypothetical protein
VKHGQSSKLLDQTGHAKVADLDVGILGHKTVARREITVDELKPSWKGKKHS